MCSHSASSIVGKSSLLSVLGNREVPIPEHIDIFHLKREMPPSDKTALECVMEVDEMRVRLEHEAEELAMRGGDDEGNLLPCPAYACSSKTGETISSWCLLLAANLETPPICGRQPALCY